MHDVYDEVVESLEIEKLCKNRFNIHVTVDSIIAYRVPTSRQSFTTVFKAGAHVFALCQSSAPLVLADIKHIMQRAGITVDAFLPPAGNAEYFKKYGQEAFAAVYPSKKPQSDQDTAYYQTLAPYSPALVRIAGVPGEIKQFIAPTQRWQTAKTFSYKRLHVQY